MFMIYLCSISILKIKTVSFNIMKSASTATGSIQSFYTSPPSKSKSSLMVHTIFQDKYQMLWFITHITTLMGFFMYSMWVFNPEKHYLSLFPSYKLTNYSCVITYLIVIYKRYLCEDHIEQNEMGDKILISYILKTENVQLIISAFLWTFTRESFFKLVPFAIYSILNISCFLVFEAYPQAPFSEALAPLINFIKLPSLVFSAYVDIFIILLLLKEAYQNSSYYVFFLYTFIWGLKIDNSDASRIALFKIINIIDKGFNYKHVPKIVTFYWTVYKAEIFKLLSVTANEYEDDDDITETRESNFYSNSGKVE